MKLVGYPEIIRVLRDQFTPTASVVLVGGLAKDRPYLGSTVVTAFNGGIATAAASPPPDRPRAEGTGARAGEGSGAQAGLRFGRLRN